MLVERVGGVVVELVGGDAFGRIDVPHQLEASVDDGETIPAADLGLPAMRLGEGGGRAFAGAAQRGTRLRPWARAGVSRPASSGNGAPWFFPATKIPRLPITGIRFSRAILRARASSIKRTSARARLKRTMASSSPRPREVASMTISVTSPSSTFPWRDSRSARYDEVEPCWLSHVTSASSSSAEKALVGIPCCLQAAKKV